MWGSKHLNCKYDIVVKVSGFKSRLAPNFRQESQTKDEIKYSQQKKINQVNTKEENYLKDQKQDFKINL